MNTHKELHLYFDGLCEPRNPGGVAAGGWYITTPDGEIIYEDCRVFCEGPTATNNVAEYGALKAGLELLCQYSDACETAWIHGDSQLVIYQVDGTWRCNKPHLEQFRDECRRNIKHLTTCGMKVGLKWVPRGENELADELSRKAYEQHTGRKCPTRNGQRVKHSS